MNRDKIACVEEEVRAALSLLKAMRCAEYDAA